MKRKNHQQLLLHLDVLNRYTEGCLFSITVRQRYKRTTWLFFLFALSRKELANTPMVFYALVICSGENYPRRGAWWLLDRKESDSFTGVSFWKRERKRRGRGRGGEGASYTCASLTSDKRISQPTRVYRVTFTKAQVSGSMARAGRGGRMNGGGEIELERQRSLRAMDLGEGFVSQSGSLDRFPSIHNALTAKNASCVTSSFSWSVTLTFQRLGRSAARTGSLTFLQSQSSQR